ncbi:MAG TPA: hypothetical protein VJ739_12910 [Gemmataceae bacterium]|nr:hypothetical protein [Gemmataceae bacterium]
MGRPSVRSDPASNLLAAIDQLVGFVTSRYGYPKRYFLNKQERDTPINLDGRVVGLVAVVAGGRIPFEKPRARYPQDIGAYTAGTGVRYFVTREGMVLTRERQWEAAMQSLRAAVCAVVEVEASGQKATKKGDIQKDNKTESRDKWIYDQCCKRTAHDRIVAQLRERAGKKGWRVVSSKQRIQQIGNEYADRHGLERPPPRQNL